MTPQADAVRRLLISLGIETSMIPFSVGNEDPARRRQQLQRHFWKVMDHLGLNVEGDDSLRGTPARMAKLFVDELFYGLDYDNFPSMTTVHNKMGYDEMIKVKCQVKSMCEHHFVPFIGVAHVAYIPNTKILGLSKFNRCVDFFSRRPQIQERLTEQIHATLKLVLETEDVALVIQAVHLCVQLRGVKDETSSTVTSKVSGRFKTVPELRAEFLAFTR